MNLEEAPDKDYVEKKIKIPANLVTSYAVKQAEVEFAKLCLIPKL